MSNYDFKDLSDYDFELLVRDLFQEEFNVVLEAFGSGRDKGIDLRHALEFPNRIIVQCKHYANSSFSKLRTSLKQEIEKVEKLKPHRYIVATSFDLTITQKDEILGMFKPYLKGETDIFGKIDINNLVNKFPKIERQHFKLWIFSTNIMERIFHSGLVNQSQIEYERIRKKLRYFVHTENVDLVQNRLEKYKYCIITGTPGIGKSTLADILLAKYASEGYEIIKVVEKLREAYDLYKQGTKQIFFYDDFLGDTRLSLAKNEDKQLLDFIDVISNSEFSLFIMTSRDYILEQAKTEYEKLAQSNFDLNRFVLRMNNYDLMDRAKILFNHLYYFNAPNNYKRQVVRNFNYRKIIIHRNYNPRIIEWMLKNINIENTPPEHYIDEFLKHLDYPSSIWNHAYKEYITDSARNVMTLLPTLPNYVYSEVLLFLYLKSYFDSEFITPFASKSFNKALKELEGNFIKIDREFGTDKLYISYDNPSIKDYMESQTSNDFHIINFLLKKIIFFEQVEYMSFVFKKETLKSKEQSADIIQSYIDALLRSLHYKSPQISPYYGNKSFERRIEVSIIMLNNLEHYNSVNTLIKLITEVKNRLENDICESERDLLSLITEVKKLTHVDLAMILEDFLESAHNYFLNKLRLGEGYDLTRQYGELVDFIKVCTSCIDKGTLSVIKREFHTKLNKESERMLHNEIQPAYKWLSRIIFVFTDSPFFIKNNVKQVLSSILLKVRSNSLELQQTEPRIYDLLKLADQASIKSNKILKSLGFTQSEITQYKRLSTKNKQFHYDDDDFDARDFIDEDEYYLEYSEIGLEIDAMFDSLLDKENVN